MNNNNRADGKSQKYTKGTHENQSRRQITEGSSAEFSQQEADSSLRFAEAEKKHGHQPLIQPLKNV